jgi:hypothetical protein
MLTSLRATFLNSKPHGAGRQWRWILDSPCLSILADFSGVSWLLASTFCSLHEKGYDAPSRMPICAAGSRRRAGRNSVAMARVEITSTRLCGVSQSAGETDV